jgi:hypothetical protein
MNMGHGQSDMQGHGAICSKSSPVPYEYPLIAQKEKRNEELPFIHFSVNSNAVGFETSLPLSPKKLGEA